jgi:phenylacetate-CoA ligase
MLTQVYRHLIIPGFESLLKGRSTFQFWRELEESQWWSREQLETLQLRRLRQLIDYCFAHSPYYRELWSAHGLALRNLQSLEDIRSWPVTQRQVMQDHADRIRSDAPGLEVVAKATGGSSGVPLRFEIDREANDRRTGALYRGYGWAGAAPGIRHTHLWGVTLGNTSRLHRWKERLYSRYLYRRDLLNVFEMSDDSIPQFLARIHRFKPDVLIAYANPLYMFARTIEERGLPAYRPKALIVGSERLHDFQRELIERVFAAPVFETYGSREFTLIGAECERHTGLHLTMENLLVEVVDEAGRPAPPGEEGDVVITDLFNVAMPFVRYAIGDRALAGFGSCSCGRGLPVLKEVAGRQMDILVTCDGRRLPGIFFPHLLKDYAAVRQFQVVQPERDLVELKLVVDDRWEQAARESLRREVQHAVGDATRLLIKEVDEIPLTAMGKLRVVVGHTHLSQHTRNAG